MRVFKCELCGAEVNIKSAGIKKTGCECGGTKKPLIASKEPVTEVPCSDRVMPRAIDKMHVDFERFISSTLNWPIERVGPYYNDKKTAGAWEVYKFAKVA